MGEPIDIHVLAEDFDQDPTPDVMTPHVDPALGALQFIGVTPKVSSSISIVNGSVTRTHEVLFAFRYRYLAREPGAVRIAPFSVSQGGRSLSTASVELKIREVPTSNVIDVAVGIPDGPIFVGQKVPVFVEFWIDREVQNDLVSYALDVPLLSSPNLRFIDEPGSVRDTELTIQSDAGTLLLPARSMERVRNGRTYLVVRAERTMVPLSPGQLDIAGARVVIDQGVQFRRDMFRQRQATTVRKLMARTRDIELEVAEVPLEGRPSSFAGAIGRGFTLDVSADRSVVQLGEPIALRFMLRGDGDLSSAGLPPLDAEGLFDSNHFRLPEDRATGVLEDDGGGGKQFELNVRVLDAAVREIPALAYSWFDADSRRFETTHSRPIALSVGAAQVIGAGQVERRPGSEDEPASERSPAAGSRDSAAERASSLALTGANLAVERDTAALFRDERAGGTNAVLAGSLYALGLGLIGLAIFDRRRSDVDPEVAALRRKLAGARRDVEGALARPASEAAETASRALRTMLSLCPNAAGPELDALLGELDARSYAPPSLDDARLPDALCERAREVASSIEEASL